jgi:hypothetical protein
MKLAGGRWFIVGLTIAATGCQGTIQDQTTIPSGSGGRGGDGGRIGQGGAADSGGGAGAGGSAASCVNLDPIPRRLWRLSVDQYANAVRDLLGLADPPAINTAGGTSAYAFFSPASADVDPTLQFNIYQAVQAVSDQIAPKVAQIAACNSGEADDACATRFAQRFGERAFRRPIETSEQAALMAVYAEGRKQDFPTGIRLMIEALLQAPSFIYRTELGGTPDAKGQSRLTSYEVASLLSFMLTDSSPDAQLLAAAQDGSLDTDQGVAAHVDRLLALDSVRRNVSQIVLRWFNVGQLVDKTKDPTLFAALPAADQDQGLLKNDVMTSAISFIDDVLWHGAASGKIDGLLESRRIFVNQRLAKLYGFPFSAAAGDFVAVEPPAEERRAGILTQPGFLWALSDPAVTSIVKRGKFIHDDVVCADPGPGPGSLLDDPAIQAKLATLTTEIDRSNYRLTTQPCSGCHSDIDPYALVLENFDAIGAWRTTADGIPVTAKATFTDASPLPPGEITGAVAFAKALETNKLLTSCGVQKMASYAIGRMIRLRATCEIEETAAAFAKSDGGIVSLLRGVATAPFLRVRSGGAM